VRALAEAFYVFKNNRQVGIRAIQKYARLHDADILEDTYNQFREALS
jgi:hypothetical protein